MLASASCCLREASISETTSIVPTAAAAAACADEADCSDALPESPPPAAESSAAGAIWLPMAGAIWLPMAGAIWLPTAGDGERRIAPRSGGAHTAASVASVAVAAAPVDDSVDTTIAGNVETGGGNDAAPPASAGA